MEWVHEAVRYGGLALLVLGGWSVADSLARIARAMEAGRRSGA